MRLFLCSLLWLRLCGVTLTHHQSDDCPTVLNVTNDGPATLDIPVTVSAVLECASNQSEYEFVFKDDAGRAHTKASNHLASMEYIFSGHPGPRTVHVIVYRPPFEVLASGKTEVQVGEHIPGSLDFSGAIVDEDGRLYLGTGRETNVTVRLGLPAAVLRESEFSYSWTVGEERFATDGPSVTHRFEEDGPLWVRVAVVGRVPAYGPRHSGFRYKWGYFNREVTVKDPFSSINISGNTYLEHGQLLDLDISCNGSGPVEYCWKVLPPKEIKTNLSCSETVTATECAFPILYYFRDSGDFQLAIYVNNWVTAMQRTVRVHIYDVSLRPQLSTVIIPVVCTVLVVVIVAVAVLLHMRRRLDLDVETADFDFLRPEPTTVAVETSWQIMRRSLLHLMQVRYADPGGYGTMLVNVERRS